MVVMVVLLGSVEDPTVGPIACSAPARPLQGLCKASAAGSGMLRAVRPNPLAGSVEELLAGARRLGPHRTGTTRSGAVFEAVEVDGQRCVVKYVHPDLDFTMRVSGDVGCRPRRAWELGLVDACPAAIDHATLGAAPWGRSGFGVALLMRDVSGELVPEGDEPLEEAQHERLLDHLAGLSAATWGWRDDDAAPAFLPYRLRWAWFSPAVLATEAELGFPEPVPRIALDGWHRFAERVPRRLAEAVRDLHADPRPLADALRTTPSTLLHGDWKLSNLGLAADGRTVLLDWAYPGEGPVAHELAWYLALNRARLPVGWTKERTMERFEESLRAHGIDTAGWWDRQLDLCLLGAVVQFGWEKALGDDAELGWWTAVALDGLDRL
jgi:hypothetical protein